MTAPALGTYRAHVREFIRTDFLPHQARWREQQHPGADAWAAAGAAGLLLADVPKEYGGGGGTFAHTAVVVEELAAAGVPFASFIQNVVGQYILTFGREEQKRRWLPPLARGELIAAIAMSEPATGSDLQGITTTARREGDQYVINGAKTFITSGWQAGLVCLVAKTDPAAAGFKGISLIMVETESLPGYRAGCPLEKVGLHGQDTCELFFDDVRVPTANLLGPVEGRGFLQAMDIMNYERLAIASAAVATAEAAVALTTAYVRERKAFGKPLMDFQHARFQLADCRTDARIGRVFLDDCIARYLAGERNDVTIAMAKSWLTDCECRIVDACVQLHGGNGYMAQYPIARMWTDSRVHRIYAGANEVLKELIASSL